MPAAVEAMAYNHERGLPWHGLGRGFTTGEIKTWNDMRDAAGLAWDLELHNVYDASGNVIDGWQRITRDDTDATLHIARGSYQPIYNHEMGPVIEALYEAGTGSGGIDWDTAGSLDTGKKVFVTAKLGGSYHIGKDPSPLKTYLALLNSHNGSTALRAIQTDVRVVCSNTFHLADMEARRSGFAFSFRHQAGWKSRVEEAKDALFKVRRDSEAVRAAFEDLVRVEFTDEQFSTLVQRALPIDDEMTPRQKSNVEAQRQGLAFVTNEDNPNLPPEIRNTAYGAYQAAGEWLDHYRAWKPTTTGGDDVYINRTLLAPEKEKVSFLDLIRDIAEDRDTKKLAVAIGS